jgi:predicted Zn finger-like uncharacterized protein
MGVDVRCPACHAHTRVPDEAVGRNIRCKECHHPFRAEKAGAAPKATGNKNRRLTYILVAAFVLLVILALILHFTGVL